MPGTLKHSDPNYYWGRHALQSIGNSALGRHEESEVAALVTQIINAIPNVSDPFAASALARAASSLVLGTRRVTLAAETLDKLTGFDAVMLQSAARQDWLTSEYRIGCLVREVGALEESLRSLSAEMAVTRTRSSSAALIALGQGGLCCGRGHYEEALAHFEAAIAIANELGNGSLLASAFANRALCYGKLGRYEQQVKSGMEALQCEAEHTSSYRRILAHYSVAIGFAMQGKRVEATNATIALGSAPVDSAAQWVQQVRHLYLADCAWLTHKKRLALRQASKGVTGPFASPLASGFTGIHARWLARIQPDQEFTRSYLEQLLNDAPSFDLFDRAEIALAVRLANEGLSPSLRRSLDVQAQAFLDELPPQVGAFFAMLEILPKPGSARRARTNKTE